MNAGTGDRAGGGPKPDHGQANEDRPHNRWHFWCHGCKDEKIEVLPDLDAEAQAGLEWFAAHSAHGLGGFIEPIDAGSGERT